MLRLGVAVVTAALAALALAAHARAEDLSTPTPLMLGKSAVIPPEDPQALPPDETPVDPSVAVVPPEAQEIPAKSTRAEQAQSAGSWQRVIPAERSKRQASPRVPRVAPVAGWYQVRQRQYQPAPSHGDPNERLTAPDDVGGATASAVENGHRSSASISSGCEESCAGDARYNVSSNAPRIGSCISASPPQSGREHLCVLLLERLRSLLAAGASTRSFAQYQKVGTQYQGGGAVGSVAATSGVTAGWLLFRPEPRGFGVLAAAATRPLAAAPASAVRPARAHTVLAVVRPPQPLADPVPTVMPRGAAAPATATATADRSTDWSLRTLLVLLGVASLALTLLASVERGGVVTAASGLGSRLRSRGLGTSGIVLGREGRRRGDGPSTGIRYRD